MNKQPQKIEEIKLVFKNRTMAKDRLPVSSPLEAFNAFSNVWDKDQINLIEECKILLLDSRLRLMSVATISKGGMSETAIDPRVVFSLAIKRRAHRFILAHNHPSGSLVPSVADKEITKNLQALGEMIRIPLEDHLILTESGFYSIVQDYNHQVNR